MVRARKYALNLYISAALSLFSMARSCGNAKIAVKTGKNPQKTAMKKSKPACKKGREELTLGHQNPHIQQTVGNLGQ